MTSLPKVSWDSHCSPFGQQNDNSLKIQTRMTLWFAERVIDCLRNCAPAIPAELVYLYSRRRRSLSSVTARPAYAVGGRLWPTATARPRRSSASGSDVRSEGGLLDCCGWFTAYLGALFPIAPTDLAYSGGILSIRIVGPSTSPSSGPNSLTSGQA